MEIFGKECVLQELIVFKCDTENHFSFMTRAPKIRMRKLFSFCLLIKVLNFGNGKVSSVIGSFDCVKGYRNRMCDIYWPVRHIVTFNYLETFFVRLVG